MRRKSAWTLAAVVGVAAGIGGAVVVNASQAVDPSQPPVAVNDATTARPLGQDLNILKNMESLPKVPAAEAAKLGNIPKVLYPAAGPATDVYQLATYKTAGLAIMAQPNDLRASASRRPA